MDDHGPQAGCTYQKCGLNKPDCPFVKDKVVRAVRPAAKSRDTHEHHYVLVCECGSVKNLQEHISVSVDARQQGWTPFA